MSNPIDFATMSEASLNSLKRQIDCELLGRVESWEVWRNFRDGRPAARVKYAPLRYTFPSYEAAKDACQERIVEYGDWAFGYYPKQVK